MTNVINTTTNSALTSSVLATNLTQQQPDDLLASLTFNVSAAGETSGSIASTTTALTIGVGQSTDDTNDVTLSSLLHPILNNNTVDVKDLKNNRDIVSDLQNHTTADMLSVLTSQQTNNAGSASVSPSMSSSQPSHNVQQQYDFTTKNDENSSVAGMWSNLDDGNNHNVAANGFKTNSYSNSLVTTLMNNTNLSSNMHQQNRRAITASHGGFQPAGLPSNNCAPPQQQQSRGMPMQQQQQQQQHANHHPHNLHKQQDQSHHMGMQQQQQQQHHPQQNMSYHHQTPNHLDRDSMHDQHRHPQKSNMYNSNYPVWSNPASSMPWQTQQQQAAINNSIPVICQFERKNRKKITKILI